MKFTAAIISLFLGYSSYVAADGNLMSDQFDPATSVPRDANTGSWESKPTIDMPGASAASVNALSTPYRLVAYFINWGIYARNFQPADIPADKITHINYAFARPAADGSILLGDSFSDIDKSYPGDTWDTTKQAFRGNFWQINKVLKGKYPQLKVLLSIGGWTWSDTFSDIAASATARKKFADDCVKMIQTYSFDGVDIDWEYPVLGGLPTNSYRASDPENYVLLLKDIREAYAAQQGGQNWLLTIATSAGIDKASKLDIPGMAQYLDFMSIMTYDFRGGWSAQTGHQTNLFDAPDDPEVVEKISTDAAVKFYLNNGFPASKIVIGGAIYGRGWAGVPTTNNGLYQKYQSVPRGTWDDWSSGNTGVFDYKDIMSKIQTGQMKRYYDNTAQAVFAYGNGMMISYDDVESITKKADYVKNNNLGGIMFWEMTGDTRDQTSLLTTAMKELGNSANPQDPNPPPPTSPPPPPPTSSSTNSPPPSTSVSPSPPTASPPPPPPPPPSGPTTPSGPTGCVSSTDSCNPSTDFFACSGSSLAQCTFGNKYVIIPCPAGTVCQIIGGTNVLCQWANQLDPRGKTCTGNPSPPSPAPSSSSTRQSTIQTSSSTRTTSSTTSSSSQPTSSPAPPSNSGVCVSTGGKCTFMKDVNACIGKDMAQCGNTNQWAKLSCPQGTQCQSVNGQVSCQWSYALDPKGVTCN